jgi:hypothetical protein
MSLAQYPVQTYMKIRSIQAVKLLLARLDLIMELKQMAVLLSPTVLSRKMIISIIDSGFTTTG